MTKKIENFQVEIFIDLSILNCLKMTQKVPIDKLVISVYFPAWKIPNKKFAPKKEPIFKMSQLKCTLLRIIINKKNAT